jgi:hypothetical protein
MTSPCDTCPFARRMTLPEASEVLENYPNHDASCEVLCHTDGFLNDQPHAECRGFRRNAMALGLLEGANP